MDISVIVPTYNPSKANLDETLNSLRAQTLDFRDWEIIIIDNNSNNGVMDNLDMTWHPNSKIIKELKQGLTYSRIAGVNNAKGNIIIMVDDDNVLDSNYLKNTIKHFDDYPTIGSIGGRITGKFNNYTPEKWTEKFWHMLAIRNYGDEIIVSTPSFKIYPDFSPVGAGMAVRKHLFNAYITDISKGTALISDRTGSSLSSGGDNEINLQVLRQGFSVAYFPDLQLAHVIPSSRLTKDYLARLNYESSCSWVKLLLKYDISSWSKIPTWTVNLRKAKAWITQKAWKSQSNYIYWRGSCGTYEGRASSNKTA